MLLKTVIHTIKALKNKAVLSLKISCCVVCSNVINNCRILFILCFTTEAYSFLLRYVCV